MILKELKSLEEMLEQLPILQELYPSLTLDAYRNDLIDMLPNNHYGQIAVFEGETCLGLTGYWIGTKLWCGKYLEIDNLIVSEKQRSTGVGKQMFDYLAAKAMQENCTMMALDSYTSNFKAHKFFYNQSFAPKGFHFIRVLKNEGIR
jgi:GNAT superfamily N-acetyltransferase